MNRYLFALLIIMAIPSSHALDADGPRTTLSGWSTDCNNVKKSRWFVLEHWGGNDYMFIICAGFKCIPYPGFWEPFDVYNDKRVKWLSETKIKVSNDDKDAGWDGYIEFEKCKKM